MSRLILKVGALALISAGYVLASQGSMLSSGKYVVQEVKNAGKTGFICTCDYYGNYIYYQCNPGQHCGAGVDNEYENTCVCE